jgi:excinuclease ABC subunit C
VLQRLQLDNQPVAALAKRLDEVYLPGASDPQNIVRSSPGLRLLQQIRDEAHRFAITYHRILRKKRTLVSELDKLGGIGEVRKKALLKYFGSVKNIRTATVDEIEMVDGISSVLARGIWEHFHVVK